MRVVKVGGSLFDMPDLGSRLDRFLGDEPTLLVAGGGPAVDAVRAFARLHNLEERAAHWLALEAMRGATNWLANLVLGVVTGFPTPSPPGFAEGEGWGEGGHPDVTRNTTNSSTEYATVPFLRSPHPLPSQSRGESEKNLRCRLVLDVAAFCRVYALPECWDLTSDSIAAHAAIVAGADELVLLKSADPPDEPVGRWHLSQYVDAYFHHIVAGNCLQICAVNFRRH